jgi:predicted Na+-dependent transporter
MAARRWLPGAGRYERAASLTATAALVGLVALVAAQVRPSTGYLPVLGGILLFLAGSAALGAVLARGAPLTDAIPVLLTVSMRDFAIAAGLAASAFGTAAAAPLGLYGVVVLVWGTAVAGFTRRRERPTP